MKTIAIITARGGSKRIPRKNIRLFLGHPIIKYSIEAALSSGCFDEVMVSTDDKEIAEISMSYGAKVPFYRSAENSDDFCSSADILTEVINEYKFKGMEFEYCCCIYPTAPFITAEKLKTAQRIFLESGADSALPVVLFSYPTQRALKINKNGFVVMIHPENFHKNSQELMPTYHDCGQFYFMKTESMIKERKHHPGNTLPIIVPETEVQDIDNETDWQLAELKYKFLNKLT